MDKNTIENARSMHKQYIERRFEEIPFMLSHRQKRIIMHFISRFYKQFIGLIALVFTVFIIQISIPIFIHNTFTPLFLSFDKSQYLFYTVLFILFITAFCVVSIYKIYIQNVFLYSIQQRLQRIWIRLFYEKRSVYAVSQHMSKLFFHFSLLHQGIRNVVFKGIEGISIICFLCVLAGILGGRSMLLLLVSIILSSIIIYLSYHITRASTASFQSHSTRYFSNIIDSFMEYKSRLDKSIISHFTASTEHLQALRYHSMVYRDTLFMSLQSVLYASIVLISGISIVLYIYFPTFRILTSDTFFIYQVLFYSLLTILFMHSMRLGSYLYTLYTGLILCIPEHLPHRIYPLYKPFTSIQIRSQKATIHTTTARQNIHYSFKSGIIQTIQHSSTPVLHSIYKVISGLDTIQNGRKYIIIRDTKRIPYNQWTQQEMLISRINSGFTTHLPIISYLQTGTTTLSFEDVINGIKPFVELLPSVFSASHNIRNTLDIVSFEEKVILHIVYGYLHKHCLFVIEPHLQHLPNINKALSILHKVAPHNIIITFTNDTQEVL